MRFAVAAVVALVALQVVTAQVVTGGRLPFSSRSNHRLPSAPVLSLGAVDVSSVSNEVPSREKPFTFAVAVPTELTTTNSGLWSDVEGGKVWRLTISSPGATSLSVAFDHFDMPKGAELHLYDASKETIVGGFTKANVKPHRQFAVRPVAGDSLTLEYFQPAAVNGVALFNITSVSHGVVDILKEYHDSGSCNVNVLCSLADNWRNQVRGVSMIMTTTGTRWCSGSMINNAKNDGRQLFLTANHCCQGQNPGKWMAVFNYDSPVCDYASEKDGPLDQTATGMSLLSNNDYSDFCLLEIEEAIPKEYNVYLNGYEALEQVPLTPFVIHHPSCDVKKISNSLYEIKSAGWGTTTGTSHWLVPQYNNGTTEPGSSGSPLFNEKQRIVGQLHGGEATCSYNYNDYYGKVSESWAHGSGMAKQLQPFLDPDNKGTKSVDGRELYA